MPLARLALVAEPRVHAGRLSVFVTSGDLERGVAPVRTAQVPVRLAHDEILDVLGHHLEYTWARPTPSTASRSWRAAATAPWARRSW